MANMDYLCNRIDELESEVATLDEKRNEYQVLSEDLENEVEALKTDNAKLLKENKKLSVKLRKAFSEIRYLDGYIATMNSDAKIRKIMDSEDEDEE
jgi:septal ring factor EnvC (AmiA/AmiB activator)